YPDRPIAQLGLACPTAELDRRIDRRVGQQLSDGWLAEVRALAGRPAGLSRTARQALGYRELLAHVEDGAPLDVAVGETKRRTRSFARRQRSWFRRDPRIAWVDADDDPLAHALQMLGEWGW
ncbi:MAG: tRNA (adenosine(37)-N6)-dimethylallyltransferase MiaA, partial [Acidimicrobiales bacterium]